MSAFSKLSDLQDALRLGGEAAVVDRIHPRMAIHTQGTGRWSITDPPLQQMPPDLLDLLLIPEGYIGLSWDWDLLHARVVAADAGDVPLLTTLRNRHDIHTITACELFGLPFPPDLKKPHTSPECKTWRTQHGWQGKEDFRRTQAKRFLYRLLKGADPYKAPTTITKLGGAAGSWKNAATRWMMKHPAILTYQARLKAQVREKRQVRDFMGRRRLFPDASPHSQRAGVDFPAQGGEVEILNTTLCAIMAVSGEALRFMYQRHDYVQLAVRQEMWGESLVAGIMREVTKPRRIGQHEIDFPATFYTQDSQNKKVELHVRGE